MSLSSLVLEYLKVLTWPALVVFALVWYRTEISSIFQQSKLKLSLFGVEINTNIPDLERAVTASVGGQLSDRQWGLLKQLANRDEIAVAETFPNSFQGELDWIRPVRNTGLIRSLPDNSYIEQATHLALTPLGKLVTKAKFDQQQKV